MAAVAAAAALLSGPPAEATEPESPAGAGGREPPGGPGVPGPPAGPGERSSSAEPSSAERARDEPVPAQPSSAPDATAAATAPAAAATGPAAAATGPAAGAAAPPSGAPGRRGPGTEVTIVPGITRYHRGECILIRFLSQEDLETMTLAAAEEAGCVPCKACRPEQVLADD